MRNLAYDDPPPHGSAPHDGAATVLHLPCRAWLAPHRCFPAASLGVGLELREAILQGRAWEVPMHRVSASAGPMLAWRPKGQVSESRRPHASDGAAMGTTPCQRPLEPHLPHHTVLCMPAFPLRAFTHTAC